jgi:transcriptional regulator with XRE-family HTH domain
MNPNANPNISNAKVFKLSGAQIAEIVGCSRYTVIRYINGHNTRYNAPIEAAIQQLAMERAAQLPASTLTPQPA